MARPRKDTGGEVEEAMETRINYGAFWKDPANQKAIKVKCEAYGFIHSETTVEQQRGIIDQIITGRK